MAAGMPDFAAKRIVSASLPWPPHITRRQPDTDRLDSSIFDLNEDRTIETEPCRGAVDPHFTVTFEHDMSTHRDGRTALEGAASAGIVADLLPVPSGSCTVVLDHRSIIVRYDTRSNTGADTGDMACQDEQA